jgi:hypothetical protein
MNGKLIMTGQKSGPQHTRHYFRIKQNVRGQNRQANASTVQLNTFPWNNYKNCLLPVVFIRVTNKGRRVNDRCLVMLNGQIITCLIPKAKTLLLVSGMQVDVPIKDFL